MESLYVSGTPLNTKINRQTPYSGIHEARTNDYLLLGGSDSFTEAGNMPYISSELNRDVYNVQNSNQMQAQQYPGARKIVLEKEGGVESHEQDMEIGYEDKPRHLTFEDLENTFRGEVLKLVEEEIRCEDAENARHRENTMKIKKEYEEKLWALRAAQATRREEFLKKESMASVDEYHRSRYGSRSSLPASSSPAGYGHAGPTGTEPNRVLREPAQPHVTRSQGRLDRVPCPSGRVYNNNTGARFQ